MLKIDKLKFITTNRMIKRLTLYCFFFLSFFTLITRIAKCRENLVLFKSFLFRMVRKKTKKEKSLGVGDVLGYLKSKFILIFLNLTIGKITKNRIFHFAMVAFYFD